MEITTRQAGAEDRDALIEAFGIASADEVVTAWLLEGQPEGGLRTAFVPGLVDRALRDDEIWVAGVGAEIWSMSIWQHVTSVERFAAEAAETRTMAQQAPDVRVLQRLQIVTDLLAREHPREFPHRYLQVIVTMPEHRGKGAGAVILADRLKAASEAGVPAFLEASTERSARLYRRSGFAATGTTHSLPENGPTLIPMWFRP
ncbi:MULTISPECIES: GNAT family N-acetyltransferase [Nocardia]|uniref:GNAT family N-acetyltransferase n=1 Tax=Nocardia abscessus TaxID=120957 RepID=A0ABS0C741_9NOCA|nr:MULTISPECIES: GNAT family N-acetyltransferase [Nocardia]MBF6226192.1 GNAT family N-acetyltransferase [Nocardia abscessus]MDE1669109.1 GNAT family N-acetyltransferase [Nocardia gipuzkoensis]